MSQLAYAINQAAAVPGVISDLRNKVIESFANIGATAIAFGVGVVGFTSDDEGCKIPTATGQPFLGVSVKTDEYHQANSGAVGYAIGRTVNVMRRGRVWVLANAAVTKGTVPTMNFADGTLGATGDSAGDAVPHAVWRSTTVAAGLAEIELNLP